MTLLAAGAVLAVGRCRDDPLHRIRRLLRRRADWLTPHAWARLLTGLEAGDVNS